MFRSPLLCWLSTGGRQGQWISLTLETAGLSYKVAEKLNIHFSCFHEGETFLPLGKHNNGGIFPTYLDLLSFPQSWLAPTFAYFSSPSRFA